MNVKKLQCKELHRIFILISILLYLCYSNSLTVPWHFDDYPNINQNNAIHLDNLSPESIYKSIFAKPFSPGEIERPIAFMSFAINWYIGKDNPLSYHIVNLIIHIITTFFLFKSIFLLLSSSNINKITESNILFVSLLSAIIWALNPIQTQAVTYIVQRMASSAAMFYILSIYQYILCRNSEKLYSIFIHVILCLIFFALSIGCKENAITLIPSILLIELTFFNNINSKYQKIFLRSIIIINIILIIASTIYIIDQDYFQSITEKFKDRPFSIKERLLTQPRILVFYLTLLFYPSPFRLSIEHNVTLSNSLFQPLTTILSISTILFIVTYSILNFKKYRIISFCILFFFINHLVESSIIPLELIFEHRNYLPSFFIFIPFSLLCIKIINYSQNKYKLLYFTSIIFITLIIIFNGIGTYLRNDVWKTEESLWTDALKKADENARPYARLAEIYGWKKDKTIKNFNISISLLKKSLEKEIPRVTLKSALINNIGKLYALYGNFPQAIEYYNQSLNLNPDFVNSRFDLAQALIIQKKFEDGLKEINIIINKSAPQTRFFEMQGTALLWLQNPKESAESFRNAMLIQKSNKTTHFFNLGIALSRSGYFNQGKWFLKLANQTYPNNSKILYGLIENCILSGNEVEAQKYAKKLIERFSLITIKKELDISEYDYLATPINRNLIEPFIYNYAIQTLTSIDKSDGPIN